MKKLLFTFFCIFVSITYLYGKGIIVNEVMANPNGGQLPEFEYIELFNNGTSVQNLSEISLKVNNKVIVLPSYLLAPQQLVVLCPKEGEPFLENYGNVIALSSWIVLSNTGATITVYQQNLIIDKVSYKDSWHESLSKKNGGWSLERINPNWLCNMASNWTSSVAMRGGTPGTPNSIFNSKHTPDIKITDGKIRDNTIRITFNVDKTILPIFTKEQILINNADEVLSKISWNTGQDTLILIFNKSLEENKLYTLTINDFQTCGSQISMSPYPLFNQQPSEHNAIVINEILFNPKDGSSDFIELYNKTEYPINLQGWKLGNRPISNQLLLISAGDFLVLTTEKETLMKEYPNSVYDHIREVPSLPAYPNQQGVVTLFSTTSLIDSLYYHSNMHNPWINNPKGVSLERASYEEETNHPGNFKSASTLVGGATPGYKNSLIVDNFLIKNNFYLRAKTVSPDGDSFEDQLEINYKLKATNYMLTVHIYNEKGILVKRLIRNESTASEGKITWDCRGDNGHQAPAGHYIYWAEIYDDTGSREVFKGSFVMVYKSQYY
ncbi:MULTISPECIES: lamin tail domain-containing protein [Sphingobacterium]|uniref:lamin tail domain-containing protein n=1 Tax=Sphingobacterium TaxID=28453 RepID=UPI0013DD69D1|nr:MULTISPECIES: lamin tail domain-containing protein [unclassified Sphingobacterium]